MEMTLSTLQSYGRCKKFVWISNLVILAIFGLVMVAGHAEERLDQKATLYLRAKDLIDTHEEDLAALEKAQQDLHQVLKLDPKYASAYVQLARSESMLGYLHHDKYLGENLQKAHEYIAKALEITPVLFDAYLAEGYIYLREKKFEDAKQSLQQAEKFQPNSAKTLLLAAQISRREKKCDEAITRAQGVLAHTQETRDLVRAYDILAACYTMNGNYEAAEPNYLKQLALDPHPWHKINYSNFLIQKGDYDKAIEIAQSALRDMGFGQGHTVLAEAYYQKGAELYWKKDQKEKAEPYFEQAVQHDPVHTNAWYGLALCNRDAAHKQRNRELLDKSTQLFRKVLQIQPTHEQAKKELERNMLHSHELSK